MLRSQEQEFQPSPWPVPASETRVTPDELTAAVAALEQKREEQARHLQGTLTLGEAVSELHLDATPDDLLAEVEAQRAKKAALEVAAQAEQAAAQARQKQAETGFAVPPSVQNSRGVRPFPTFSNRPRKRSPWVFVVAIILMGNVFGHLHAPRITINTSHSAPISAPQYSTLADVPNGKMVLCSTATLREIQRGASPAKIPIGQVDDQNRAWRIIKHDGHVYVRLQTPILGKQALRSVSNLPVNNNKNAGELRGEHEQTVTVRLDKLDWDGAFQEVDGGQQIAVSHVGLDDYANVDEQ